MCSEPSCKALIVAHLAMASRTTVSTCAAPSRVEPAGRRKCGTSVACQSRHPPAAGAAGVTCAHRHDAGHTSRLSCMPQHPRGDGDVDAGRQSAMGSLADAEAPKRKSRGCGALAQERRDWATGRLTSTRRGPPAAPMLALPRATTGALLNDTPRPPPAARRRRDDDVDDAGRPAARGAGPAAAAPGAAAATPPAAGPSTPSPTVASALLAGAEEEVASAGGGGPFALLGAAGNCGAAAAAGEAPFARDGGGGNAGTAAAVVAAAAAAARAAEVELSGEAAGELALLARSSGQVESCSGEPTTKCDADWSMCCSVESITLIGTLRRATGAKESIRDCTVVLCEHCAFVPLPRNRCSQPLPCGGNKTQRTCARP